jgi:hypothetical protein
MKDFFLTLCSDQVHFKGINNTSSCFKVHLGHEIQLSGQWSVGLAEIFFPMNMRLFSQEEQIILVTELSSSDTQLSDEPRVGLTVDVDASLPPTDDVTIRKKRAAEEPPEKKKKKSAEDSANAKKKTADDATQTATQTAKDSTKITPIESDLSEVNIEKSINIVNETDGIYHCDDGYFITLLQNAFKNANVAINIRVGKGHVWLQPEKKYKLTFSDKLSNVLGFLRTELIVEQNIMAPRTMSLLRALDNQFYISTDLIDRQMVAGKYDAVLRCTHVDSATYRHGCIGHEKYDVIYYYPVCQNRIDDVSIYIKNRFGECISFEDGPLTIVLHFRRESND